MVVTPSRNTRDHRICTIKNSSKRQVAEKCLSASCISGVCSRRNLCFQYKDKVVVVTGGGSGLGLATVKMFLEGGAKVVMGDYRDCTDLAKELGCDLPEVQLQTICEMLKCSGSTVRYECKCEI